MPLVRFDELTYIEIAGILSDIKKAGLILPIGCTEQHGPFLSVGCDTAIARGAAENLAKNLNTSEKEYRAYVLPDYSYSPSPGAEFIPGTISMSFDWLGQGLKEIVTSAIKTGWNFCVIMNGHAQNIGRAIETSMAAAQGELGKPFPLVIINVYEYASIFNKHGLTPSSHAGEAEIALYSYYTGKKINTTGNFLLNHDMRNKPANIYGLSIMERSHGGIITDDSIDLKRAIDVSNEIGREIDSLIIEKIIQNLDIYFKEWID